MYSYGTYKYVVRSKMGPTARRSENEEDDDQCEPKPKAESMRR
jgi:hypothetical protein